MRRLSYAIAVSIVFLMPLSGCFLTISRSTRRASGEWTDRGPSADARSETSPTDETGSAEAVSAGAVSAVAYAHAREKTPGGRVLAAAVAMVSAKTIVVGVCWDFVNAVYNRAGFPGARRVSLFQQAETGPFADPGLLRPGDWVMYRNLPYGEIGHSAVFVEWIDFEKRSALTIEYVGGHRKEPGQYREADLTKVWGVIRGRD